MPLANFKYNCILNHFLMFATKQKLVLFFFFIYHINVMFKHLRNKNNIFFLHNV